jgi:DNA-binding transcriptional MerR regulator
MARRTSPTNSRARSRGARKHTVLLSRSVLCSMAGVSEPELSLWETEEFLVPARIIQRGGEKEPLYARDALRRIQVIRTLAEEFEVNLPGIGIVLHLLDQLDQMTR